MVWDIILILVFAAIQGFFFGWTWKKLNAYKSALSKKGDWALSEDKQTIAKSEEKSDFIVGEINDYLLANKGTTDFGIIKDKVETHLSSLQEEACSKINFPTYLGLLGTFLGVAIGLYLFNKGVEAGGISDGVISELICGVLVSMITSVVGLLFMIVATWRSNYVQKKVDQDRQKFFAFLQKDLMPEMGSDMVSALGRLNKTVRSFAPAFEGVIEEFKNAFSGCNKLLEGSFSGAVSVLSSAVEKMRSSISLIEYNVIQQRKLLQTLRSDETLSTLTKFCEAADKFDSVSSSLERLNSVKEEIALSSQELIRSQTQYNAELSIPRELLEKTNSLLDRITTFENSINSLGKNLDQTALLGNSEIHKIESLIEDINKKTDIVSNFGAKSNEEIEKLCEYQVQDIEKFSNTLKNAFRSQDEDFGSVMREHNEKLSTIVGESRNAVEKMRGELIQEIKRYLNIESENQYLSNLKGLPRVEEAVSQTIQNQQELGRKVGDLSSKMDKIISVLSSQNSQSSHIVYPTKEPKKPWRLFRR